jgi:DNA-binding transcriptional LysR family regulator
MELHQVRYLLAVCETLNFTRAAEQCHVSQPALSRAIQQLEAELGGELFRRERRLTHITDLGRAVLPALRQCYESSLSARALAQSYLKEGHPPLQLGLARSIEMELLSPLLAEISTAFPGIEVRVFRGAPLDIGEKLKSGDVELAIAGPLGEEWERFEARELFEEQFGVLLTRCHSLSRLNTIQLPVLLTERLLCLSDCEMTERLTAKLQSLGAHKITKHEAPLVDDLLDLVRANFGVGILPMGRRIPDDLCIREVEGVDLRRWIHVVTVAGRPRSVGAATFVKLLRAKDWSAVTRREDRAAERPQ